MQSQHVNFHFARRARSYLVLLLTFWLWNAPNALAEEINLACNEKLAQQIVAGKILTDIYQRVGLVAKISPYPPLRANRVLLNGAVDGEVARAESYANDNPTLVKVTPSYYSTKIAVFSKKPLTITSIDELAKYKLGVILGVTYADHLTKGMKDVQYASNASALFMMLEAGRFDVAIDASLNGNFILQRSKITDIKEVGTLGRIDFYNILSPKKKYLEPRISKMITTLSQTGELEKIQKRYEQEFLASEVDF